MENFFPFIHVPEKKKDLFEQISLYIEEYDYDEVLKEDKEEERIVILDIL